MKQEIINLIDKVIGKKGIMRSPAWWVNRIFRKILQYTDDTVRYAESRANSRINAKENKIHTVYAAGLTADSLKTWMKQRNAFFYRDVRDGKTLTCNVCVDYGKSLSERYIPCSVSIWQNMIICAIDTDMSLYFDEIINPQYYSAWFAIYEDGDAGANISTADLVVSSRLKTINGQRILGSGNIEIGAEVVDNLESESTTAALSAKQGKVLKEMIEDKPIIFYYPLEIQGEIREITEEQKAINAEGYAKVVNALINGMKPNIIIPLSEIQAAELSGISGGYGGSIPTQVLYIAPNTPLSEVYGTGLMVYITGDLYSQIIISEDGSAMAQKS